MDWSLGIVEVENEIQAEYQASIDRNRTEIASNRTEIASNRTEIASNRTEIASNRTETQRVYQVNAILDLLVEDLNLNSNEQMAKSFESIANDATL